MLNIYIHKYIAGCDGPHRSAAKRSYQGQGRGQRVPGCVGTGVAERSYTTSEVRGGGCTGKGGPRGATPCSRSGGAAVRRYFLSKVRSSGCTLLEQP